MLIFSNFQINQSLFEQNIVYHCNWSELSADHKRLGAIVNEVAIILGIVFLMLSSTLFFPETVSL